MKPEPLPAIDTGAPTAVHAPGDTVAVAPVDPSRPIVAGYDILSELGRGGMGVVYRARQKSLDRVVALKVLLAGGHADADLIARFRTEAAVVAQLLHPQIVQIYEVGATDGHPYFSLEFVPGGSLDEKLKHQPLAPREAAEMVRTIALGVQAAHEAGIIHRDLKPANILLTTDGAPKIADFGLAKQLAGTHAVTHTGDIMGTPSYMAPEQAGGMTKSLGPACDIYALGAILYELLVGAPPFRGHDPMEIVLQVLSEDPVSVRRLAPKTPRDLETICLKCLEKQPKKRYASAQELADDLHRFLDGLPVQARRISIVEKGWKWAQRRPAVAALILVSVVSLATIISYGAWKNQQLAQALIKTTAAKQTAEKNLLHAVESAGRRLSQKGSTSTNPLVEELTFFEKLSEPDDDSPEALYGSALATGWIAYIRGEMNETAAAEKAFNQSIAMLRGLHDKFPTEATYQHALSNTIYRYGVFLTKQGDQAGAKREYLTSVQLLETLPEPDRQDAKTRILLGAQYNNLAITIGQLGEDPEPYYQKAIDTRQKLVEEFPDQDVARYDLTISQSNLASARMRKQQYAQAEQVLRECLQQLGEAPDSIRDTAEYRRALAGAHLNLGVALEQQKQPVEAAQEYAAGTKVLEGLVELYPQSVPARLMLIDAANNHSKLLVNEGHYTAALPVVQRVVKLWTLLAQEYPDNTDYAAELAKRMKFLEQLRRVEQGLPPE